MHHRLKFFLQSLLLLTLLAGCSHKKELSPDERVTQQSRCVVDGTEAPKWVCGLHRNTNYYAAVGSAPKSVLGFGFSRESAVAHARANLARQVSLDIKTKIDRWLRSTGAANDERAERVVESVASETARISMHDSQQIAIWQHPDQGTLYVLVKVPKKTVFDIAKKSAKSSFESDDARWQQSQAHQALERLDRTFEE